MQFCCHFYIQAAIFISTNTLRATMKANSVLKAQHSSYRTQVDEGNNLRVQNVQNRLFNMALASHRFSITDYKLEATAEALKQAWGLDRLKTLNQKNEGLSMVYRLSREGNILEIEFVMQDEETSITINELEALETALKSTILYPIVWQDAPDETSLAFTAFAIPFRLVIALLEGDTKTGVKITQVILTPPPLPDHLKNL